MEVCFCLLAPLLACDHFTLSSREPIYVNDSQESAPPLTSRRSPCVCVCLVCRCNMWKERAEQYLPRGVSRKASTLWSTTATCCSSPTPRSGRRNMLRTLPPAATCTTSSTSARNTGPLLNFPFFYFLPPVLGL